MVRGGLMTVGGALMVRGADSRGRCAGVCLWDHAITINKSVCTFCVAPVV